MTSFAVDDEPLARRQIAMLATQLLSAAKQASGEIDNPTTDRNFH